MIFKYHAGKGIMKPRFMPTTYFLVLLLTTIVLRFVLPLKTVVPSPFNYLGVLPIIFGAVLNLWTDRLFKDGGTTVKPHQKPTLLIESGPFGISRHPMYLGMASILLGTALISGSALSFVFPAIFVMIMEVLFIPMEEKKLEEEFGEKYMDYKTRTRRWV